MERTYDDLVTARRKNKELAAETEEMVTHITDLFNEHGETMTTVQLYNMTKSLLSVAANMVALNENVRSELDFALTLAGFPTPTPAPRAENGAPDD